MSHPQDPIFVLSAPSLPAATLAAALGQNPKAYGLPEINLTQADNIDAFQRDMATFRAAMAHGLLRAVGELYAGEQSVLSVEMARRWVDARGWKRTGTVYTELVERIAPLRAVVPVVSLLFDASAMRRLMATFPNAVFVILWAHPRVFGTIASNSKVGEIALQLTGSVDETYEPPLPDPQGLWLEFEAEISRHMADVPDDRIIRVRVETLAHEPEETLRALAKSLKLSVAKASMAAMLRPEASPFAGPGPIGAHANIEILPFPELAELVPEADDVQLDGPLSWRPDDEEFAPELREVAVDLGLS